MAENKRLNIESALDEYKVLHTPSNLSWKQHLVKDVYTHDNILDCSITERMRYLNRLKDSEVLICDNIKTNTGKTYDLSEIIALVTDKNRMNIPKLQRQVAYGCIGEDRPVGNKAFDVWNGFQMIDIDIKADNKHELAIEMRDYIFEKLKDFNWFFLSAVSNSGTGVHILTKIQVPDQEAKRKMLYYCNYRHKYSFIYLLLKPFMKEHGFTKEDLVEWMDQHMMKPQQGTCITCDPDAKISSKFFEDFIYVDFNNVESIEDNAVNWVCHPELREIFIKWTWFDESDNIHEAPVVLSSELPMFDTKNAFHYKHNERWRLANTLVKLYGLDEGVKILRRICTSDVPTREIQADCRTAVTYNKEIDEWAIHRLNSYHGFKIKLNKEQEVQSEVYETMINLDNPLVIGNKKAIEFHLTSTQYLGHIKNTLKQNFKKITLIEAGAGLGKTEMIKSFVKDGDKVIMVMPFTSTIKSKVEQDKDWAFSYANKKPDLDARGLALTVDKFSHLNPMDLKILGFKYIFIDESHLLFMSEYRPVMAKVIELIRQLEIPVIFTTGTPVAESIFFPDLQYIKVTKDDTREKDFSVFITHTEQDCLYHMCKSMANDISAGKKILFPTNAGTMYQNKIRVLLEHFLDDEVVVNYYKKSNNGEDFMDEVNFNKTVSNSNVLMCSTFLSVGVDINDRDEFVIYTNSLWMPQELEQFANRLRNNNLHIKLFLADSNANGESKRLMMFKPYNPKLNTEEIMDMHSILRICNATIERNPTEYKYNSLVNNIIYTNKFVELNEVDNKYYFNDVAYKVTFFERKYREYVQQLIVLYNAMRCYGYKCNDINVSYINEGYEQDDNFASALAEAKIVKTAKIADQTAIANELLDIITEDRIRIYKDAMEGRYEIKKGNVWNEDIHSMIMTVKDIEVFEKVVPTFISMSKNYSIKSIKGMFNYCVDKKGNYKWADLKRLKKLITIQYNAKRDRIDLPMAAYMNNIDKFIDDANERTANDINMFIAENAEKFAKEHSIGKIDITKSRLTMENIINHFTSLFDILIEKKKTKKKNSAYKLIKRQLLWKERDEEMIEDINEHRYAIEQFFPEFIEAINDLNSTNKIVSLNEKTKDANIVEQDNAVDNAVDSTADCTA